MSEQSLPDRITDALRNVLDPEIGRDLVTLEMIKGIEVDGTTAKVEVELTTPACPLKDKIRGDVDQAVLAVDGIDKVEVDFSARVRGSAAPTGTPLPGVRNSIAVASGKGGVGKSTVAVNLAAALMQAGASVGLLDCDIYGPSVPKMTATEEVVPDAEEKFQPVEQYGLKLMSIGYLVPPGQSVVWRGPLVHKAIQQFIEDVDWGDLDYLLIDLPPGTGDAQLSLSQTIPLTGAVMVTTPQDVALIDVRKGANMLEKVSVPILGIVENMSFFVCPDCGKDYEIFGRGGGAKIAKALDVPFLGEIPIDPQVRIGGDDGKPSVLTHPDTASSAAFLDVAKTLAGRISQMHMSGNVAFKGTLPVIK